MPKLLSDEEITQLCQHAAVCAQQIIDHTDRYTDANDLHKTVVKLAYTARVRGRALEKMSEFYQGVTDSCPYADDWVCPDGCSYEDIERYEPYDEEDAFCPADDCAAADNGDAVEVACYYKSALKIAAAEIAEEEGK